MTCERCHGLMLGAPLDKHDTGLLWLWAWRCVTCGNCVDSVIQQKRTMQKRQAVVMATPSRSRRRMVPEEDMVEV
jgi:hypothetical protein